MKTTRRRTAAWLGGLGLALTALSGCQTWVGGMTLPSGHYLEHQPQYFAPTPPFPLPRELAYQESVAVNPGPAGALPPPLPAPVPGAGGAP